MQAKAPKSFWDDADVAGRPMRKKKAATKTHRNKKTYLLRMSWLTMSNLNGAEFRKKTFLLGYGQRSTSADACTETVGG